MTARRPASPGGFRSRALAEAHRYGHDPWVLVRELVQNARDAGAGRVDITTARADGVDRLTCRDDGEGMSLADARRFLFTLYASSKHGEGRAGRFGVGFWSVLRFEPSRVLVRSRRAGEQGWEVALDRALNARLEAWQGSGRGTEVVLERPAQGGALSERVRAAAHRYARFVTLRDDPHRPLVVTVDGQPVNRPFTLPGPSRPFAAGSVRGVVALGAEPRVELLCCGLLVREATLLEELAPRTVAARRGGPAAAGAGLAPQVLVDDPGLEVLLARGDVREDRRLRRVVRLARRELRRLVRDHLDRVAPRGRLGRVVDRLRALPRLRTGVAVAAAGVIAWGGLWLGRDSDPARPETRPVPALAAYGGPTIDPPGPPLPPLELSYLPAGERPHLGVLRVATASGPASPDWPAPAPGATVIDLAARLAVSGSSLRLPLPSGTTVIGGVAVVDGTVRPVRRSPSGDAVVGPVAPGEARVRFRAAAAAAEGAPSARPAELPPLLAGAAERLRQRPVPGRVAAAERLVAETVRYDRGPAASRRHASLLAEGREPLAAALVAGAGDCDVQNGVLAALLGSAGVPARLVVGYRGRDGGVSGELHAWVEAWVDGKWVVADASALAAESGAHVPPPHAHAVERTGGAVLLAAAGLAGAVLVAGGLAAAAVARRRRAATSSSDVSLEELLRGALSRPGAFAWVPALGLRPLVPRLRGGRLSLRDLERLRRVGRLVAARGAPGPLPPGVVALDARDPLAAVAAEVLELPDAAAWWQRLESGTVDGITAELEACARSAGERWQVRRDGGGDRIECLALGRGRRWVLVGAGAPECRGAAGPAEGAYRVLAALGGRGELPPARSARLLWRAARAVALEVGG